MKCHVCGTENPEDYLYCLKCGSLRQAAQTSPAAGPQPGSPASSQPAYPASQPDYENAAPAKKSNAKPWLILGIGLVVVCLLLVVAAGAFLFFNGGTLPGGTRIPVISDLIQNLTPGKGGSRILVGFPDRRNESDLYLIQPGKSIEDGTLIFEGMLPGDGYIMGQDYNLLGSWNNTYGGFSWGGDALILGYLDGDTNNVAYFDLSSKELTTILDSEDSMWGYVLPDGKTVMVYESRSSGSACYLSQNGAEAERLAKSQNCYLSNDFSTLISIETHSSGATSISTFKLSDPENEVIILDKEDFVDDYRISGDGSTIAYEINEDGEKQIFLVNAADGEPIFETDKYEDQVLFGFSPHGNAFYVLAENEDGVMELSALRDGDLTFINSGLSASVMFNDNGAYLAYVLGDEDSHYTAYIFNMSSGEEIELMDSDNTLTFGFTPPPDERLMISEQASDEITLYSVPLSGDPLIEVFNENDLTFNSAYYYVNSKTFFIYLNDYNYNEYLYVAPLDSQDGFYLLEEWASVNIQDITQDGKTIIFTGYESSGDDTILYQMPVEDGADPQELDDSESDYNFALLNSSQNAVLYNAVTGTDYDEVEVRQVTLDDNAEVTTLYENAFLADAEWYDIYPLKYVSFTYDMTYGTSFCPGAPSVNVGDTVSGTIDANGYACYKIQLNSGELTSFTATSTEGLDLNMTLYDRDGVYINYDDDNGANYDPWLSFTPESSSTYYIQIGTYSTGSTGSITLSVYSGTGDVIFDTATVLNPNQTIREYITSDEYIYVRVMDLYTYGDVYYFEGQSGQYVTIDVSGYSYGSPMDPTIMMFDPSMAYLTQDDDSGDSYDAQIYYTLPTTGRYYLVVYDHYNYYGTGTDYWYDLVLTSY